MLVLSAFTRFPRSFHAMQPPPELLAAAVRRGPRSRRPTPRLRAHRSRPAALTLTPRRSAAAWPHRRWDELNRRLPCFAPPYATACVAGLAGRPSH